MANNNHPNRPIMLKIVCESHEQRQQIEDFCKENEITTLKLIKLGEKYLNSMKGILTS